MSKKNQTKKTRSIKSGTINRTQVLKLVNEYKAHFYGKQDTNRQTMYAWFDLDKLLTFLLEMKILNKADGIRIYYGAVPAKESSYENRHTIALVATKQTEDPYKYDELVDDKKKSTFNALVPAFDFASLCPPDNRHIKNETKSVAYAVYMEKKKTRKKKR